ncbi:GNAT family N-acetyltransferase [Cryobacterium serini]|uniref:GNAT family N-acetyltransferase n=1 Tax=Cryobacterium serini TaxID=1259201 RepID=UPI00141AFF75|nr:GNAT family protein [Cryobacterium serini]
MKWRNDPSIWLLTGSAPTRLITLDDELAWIRTVIADQSGRRFAIEVDHQYVGNTYLTNIHDARAEFHIFIGDKSVLGRGVAKEATRLVLNFARTDLALEMIELSVNPSHVVAVGLYRSLGFVPTSTVDGVLAMAVDVRKLPDQ